MKKIVASVVVLVLLISNSISVHAGYIGINSCEIGLSSNMLNCYTSGAVTDGTLVSLWSFTGNKSQQWEYRGEANGRSSLRSAANPAMALNANRSYIGVNANVITAETNVLKDYTLLTKPVYPNDTAITMVSRAGHAYTIYLTSHGANAICTWEYKNSSDNQIYHQFYF